MPPDHCITHEGESSSTVCSPSERHLHQISSSKSRFIKAFCLIVLNLFFKIIFASCNRYDSDKPLRTAALIPMGRFKTLINEFSLLITQFSGPFILCASRAYCTSTFSLHSLNLIKISFFCLNFLIKKTLFVRIFGVSNTRISVERVAQN